MAAAASYACTCNCTDVPDAMYLLSSNILGGTDEWLPWHEIVGYFSYNPWIFSLLGSTVVGLTGIFPLWLIPIQDGVDLKTGVLLTIMPFIIYFLSLPEFVNFYLRQQKRKQFAKRQISKRQKQETENKEHIVDESLFPHTTYCPLSYR